MSAQDDELVWVATVKANSSKVYHTEKCRCVGEDHIQRPLAEAKKGHLTECQYCSGEYEEGENPGRSKDIYQKALAWSPDE